jgi:hypothetical protein
LIKISVKIEIVIVVNPVLILGPAINLNSRCILEYIVFQASKVGFGVLQNSEGVINKTIVILAQLKIGVEEEGSNTEKMLFIIIKNS